MKVRQDSQGAQAFDVIKQDIIWSRLAPGEKFTKVTLSERYGFGDAPLRDALNRLSQDGLVVVMPREGYVVAPVTLQQIRELFEVRLILEPRVAAMAAGRIDEAELRSLEVQVTNRFDLADREALERYVRANSLVHLAIARASANGRLVRFMETIIDEMERIMLLSYVLGDRAASSEYGHGPTIQALADGNAELAATTMREELILNRRFVEEAFLRAPGALQTVNLAAGALNSSHNV